MSRYASVCLFLLTVNVSLAPSALADAPQDRVSVPLGEFTSSYDGGTKWEHAARFEDAIVRSAGTPLARAPLHLTRVASDGKVRFFYRSRLHSSGEVPVGVRVEVLRQQSEQEGAWERVWSSRTELPVRGTSAGEEVSPIVTLPVGFGAPPVATFRVVVRSYAGDRETPPAEAMFSLAFPSRFFVPLSEQLALEPGAIWLDAHVSRTLYAQLRQSLQQFLQTRAAPQETERPSLVGPAFAPDTVQTAAAIVERLRDVAPPGAPPTAQRTTALGDVGGSLPSLKTYLSTAAIVAPRAPAADAPAMQVFQRQHPELLRAVDALTGEGDGSLQRLAQATRPYFVAAVGGTVSTDYAPLQRQLWTVLGSVAKVQQALSVIGDYAPPVVENGVPVVKPARAHFAPAAAAFGDFFLRVNAHLAVLTAFYERMDTRAQGMDLPVYTMPPSPEHLVITVGNSRPNDAGLHRLAAHMNHTFTVTADGQTVPDVEVSFYRVAVQDGQVDAPEPVTRVTDARGRVTVLPDVGGYWVQAAKDGYVSALFVFEAFPTPQARRPPPEVEVRRVVLPDLVVADIYANSSLGFLSARQPAWLFARIGNIGHGDAQGPFYVVFEGKRGTSPFDRFETIGVVTVPRINRITGAPPNARYFDHLTVRTDWVPPAPGDYTLRVTVNPNLNGAVEPLEESDFRNNSRTVAVRVGGTAYAGTVPNAFSLSVTGITVVPTATSLCVQQPVTIVVRVCNLSRIAVPFDNLSLRLLAGGALVTEYVLPCWVVNGFERNYLAPGEEALITGLTWTPTIAGRIPLVAEIVGRDAWTGVTFSSRARAVYVNVLNAPLTRAPLPPVTSPPPRSAEQRPPDLVVSPASIQIEPAEPSTHDAVRVKVTVHNDGDGEAQNVLVRATVAGADNSQTAVQSIPLIRGGESAAVILIFPTPNRPGRYAVHVEVSLQDGSDRRRGNNAASRVFHIRRARAEKSRETDNESLSQK